MFKQSRFFFSAAIAFALLASTFVFSTNISAKTRKCPVEPPRTLLSLYLGSSSVFIADVRDEKAVKTEGETEDEDGNYFDIERNLDVVKVFKGQKLKEFSFTKSEYRAKAKTEETDEERIELIYDGRSYGISTELKVGKRYLFFFSKTEESGEVYPTDYRAPGREITSENADVYDKKLSKLGKIMAQKKNQIPNLAEWLVGLTEEEITRWDGASALSRSFSSLGYEEENAEIEEVTDESEEELGDYSAVIAKNVTAAQKERLSAVFLQSLNQNLFGGKDEDYDYALAELVANWDGARFAMYGFGMLQAIDRADVEKTEKIMNFVSNMVNDSTLSSLYYRYTEVREAMEEAAEGETIEAEKTVETVEIKSENAETVAAENTVETKEAEPEADAEELTPAQIREQIFGQFVDRYNELLARNFAPEPEAEDVAENAEATDK